jgi:hypothetical protein
MLALFLFDEVDRRVAELSHDDYDVRESATQALIDMGAPIQPRLRALRPADEEARWRIRHILAVLGSIREANLVVSLFAASETGWEIQHLAPPSGRWTLGRRGLLFDREPFPLDRIVPLGQSEGRHLFALAVRNARWLDGEPTLWRPRLAAELRRPVTDDVPAAFRLLLVTRAFPESIPMLEELSRDSSDPLVRELSRRALAAQR